MNYGLLRRLVYHTIEKQQCKSYKIDAFKLLTRNKELLSEGAAVKCSNLLLQAHSKNT